MVHHAHLRAALLRKYLTLGAIDHAQLVQLADGAFGNLPEAPQGGLVVPNDPATFVGSDVRVRMDDMPLAHIALSVESGSWLSEHAFPLMVMQQLLGTWDRTGGAGANQASKRVGNIVETLTYLVYRYINRGLYERDKLTFLLGVGLKILLTAGRLDASAVTLFLKGGAALDILSSRKKPFAWLADGAWLNALQLSSDSPAFKTLADDIQRNEEIGRASCRERV